MLLKQQCFCPSLEECATNSQCSPPFFLKLEGKYGSRSFPKWEVSTLGSQSEGSFPQWILQKDFREGFYILNEAFSYHSYYFNILLQHSKINNRQSKIVNRQSKII